MLIDIATQSMSIGKWLNFKQGFLKWFCYESNGCTPNGIIMASIEKQILRKWKCTGNQNTSRQCIQTTAEIRKLWCPLTDYS